MRMLSVLLATTAALFAMPAMAQGLPATAADAGDEGEGIVVYGNGETRQVQEIQAADIQLLTPGTSAIRAIEKLPSVNFQAADPFGNYEWSTRVTIRSFNQNQLGFTFDGIPLGDMSYGNHNGLHISRADQLRKYRPVPRVAGRGIDRHAIDQQSWRNARILFGRSADGFGVDANATYGSNNTIAAFAPDQFGQRRWPARLHLGTSMVQADKWKGEGQQRTGMFNAKASCRLAMRRSTPISAIPTGASRTIRTSRSICIARLGYDWDNFSPTMPWRSALPISATIAAIPVRPITECRRRNRLSRASRHGRRCLLRRIGPAQGHAGAHGSDGAAGRHGQFRAQGLLSREQRSGHLGYALCAQPEWRADVGPHDRIRYRAHRHLWRPRLPNSAANEITVGAWYENNDFNQARRFYGYESRTAPGPRSSQIHDRIRSSPSGSSISTPRPSSTMCRTRSCWAI